MEPSKAAALILRSVADGRTSGAYLVCGSLKDSCEELVGAVLAGLFPGAADQIASRTHPDVVRLVPQGRSRTIKVERPKSADSDEGPGMRDGMIEPMSATSYSGGWKVGIIQGADRMQPAAANAFLKILEEPPPRTMFLLLTDEPDSILPTIISRCQRIDLPRDSGLLEGDAYDDVAEVFEKPPANGTYAKSLAAARLAEIIAELKKESADEETALVRKAFYRTIMSFVRRWMVDGSLPYHRSFVNVEAVETAFRQSEKSISDELVLGYMMDRMVFP